jgi:acyl-CoA reductase-like NAD-dependent aldehyde dehydrogenase
MTTTQSSAPAQLPHFSLVIDGQLTEPASGRRYESIDPFSGVPWATAADGGEADVNLAVAAARRALAVGAADRVRPGPAHAAAGRAHRAGRRPAG